MNYYENKCIFIHHAPLFAYTLHLLSCHEPVQSCRLGSPFAPLYIIYYIGGQIWCPLADICLPGQMQCRAVEYAARCRGRCSALRWPLQRAAISASFEWVFPQSECRLHPGSMTEVFKRQEEISVRRLQTAVRSLWMAVQRLWMCIQRLRTEISACFMDHFTLVPRILHHFDPNLPRFC